MNELDRLSNLKFLSIKGRLGYIPFEEIKYLIEEKVKMSRKDGIIIIQERKHKTKTFTWVFIGILGFIAIYVPFFGFNLQYQVGTFFHFIFSKLGELCIWAGWVLFGFSILGTIYSRKIYLKSMAFGILLLWIGAFLTGQAFELLGFQMGGNRPPEGYR